MPRIDDLELCIEQINNANTPEDAFAFYCSVMEESGYSRVTYSLVTDHPSLDLPKQHGLATSFPEDWMKYYNEHDYLDIDPVIYGGVLKTRKPFFWSDLSKDPDLSEKSLRILDQADEAGICSGISFAMLGLYGEVVGIGLARDCRDEARDYDFLAKAYLLSVYFHETYRDMLIRGDLPKLTPRESDVLHWASEGKTDDEIAVVLGISSNTIRFHWKNLFQKLGANGRIYAITKSIRMGLIQPKTITPLP